MYKAYDESVRRSDHTDYRAYLDRRFGSIFKDAGAKSVLDIGCGNGTFLDVLDDAGIRPVGVEMDPDFANDLRARGRAVIEGNALEVMDSVEERFDGAFAAHLIEHLSPVDALKLMKLTFDRLNPGGRFVLVTPNVRSIIQHVQIFYRDYTHVRFYPAELLGFLLGQAGFTDPQPEEIPESTYIDPQKVTPITERPKKVSGNLPVLPEIRGGEAVPRVDGEAIPVPERPQTLAEWASGWEERRSRYGPLRRFFFRVFGIDQIDRDVHRLAKTAQRAQDLAMGAVEKALRELATNVQQQAAALSRNRDKTAGEVLSTLNSHQKYLTRLVEDLNVCITTFSTTQALALRHADVINFLLRNVLRPNDLCVVATKPAAGTSE